MTVSAPANPKVQTDITSSKHPRTYVQILLKFISLLKEGKVGGQVYSKIIGVGHSYGSIELAAASAIVPDQLSALQSALDPRSALRVFLPHSAGHLFYDDMNSDHHHSQTCIDMGTPCRSVKGKSEILCTYA
ncbi:hypothetical protein CALCODRAFT_187418 [Calocera cornea HHB12733]|uniref:AB hydrolase-1 domain-containing protein n=1 Tax=Calocera cornea HHB12733 TaxID=1353952 RepID=A0A165HPU0_9BASI|nr:hypothetical protein CALCODRAFT_187418 [Calocera cornea HHB12733]